MTEESKTIPLPSVMKPLSAEPTDNLNPLTQYFRHSKINITLPTAGRFWPDGCLVCNEDGSLDVMAMTARDEILLKSPEGLLSGSSVVSAISSCISGIKDPWKIPGHDLDTILIAIRIASYGHDLEITTQCKHCNASNTNTIDLRSLLDSIPKDGIKNIYKLDDLTFEFFPYDFAYMNKNNKAQFDQEQLARSIVNENTNDEDKKEYFKKMFNDLAVTNAESLIHAITKISLPDGTVVKDKEMIGEFINNADRETIKNIKAKLTDMNESASIKPMQITCDECEKSYETSIEFNQSNFFE